MRAVAVLLAVILLAWPAALVGYAGQVQVCRDWIAGHAVGCGEPIPQGAPWVVVGGPLPAGTRVIFSNPQGVNVCDSGVLAHEYAAWACYAVPPGDSWTPGTWRVRVVRPAAGDVVAETSFQVTIESPQDALTRHRGPSAYDRASRILALARLGRTDDALAEARDMERSGEFELVRRALDYEADLLSLQGRYREAEAAEQRAIALYQQRGLEVNPKSWLILARLAKLACDWPTALAAAARAAQAAPGDPRAEQLLVEIEQAQSAGACAQSGR
jgi:tetratricopeptide (TPR) repeat protein